MNSFYKHKKYGFISIASLFFSVLSFIFLKIENSGVIDNYQIPLPIPLSNCIEYQADACGRGMSSNQYYAILSLKIFLFIFLLSLVIFIIISILDWCKNKFPHNKKLF